MKTKFTFILVFFFIAFQAPAQQYLKMIDSNNFTVDEIVASAEAYFANHEKGRGSGYKPFKRWEYMAYRLMDENGYLPTLESRISTLQNYNAYLNETASDRNILPDNWEELGPTAWNATTAWSPGVGRITGIAVDRNNNNHIIVGANTGGVWKTLDGGQNWVPLTDYFSNLYVYSVAMDPANSNIYYFGSDAGLIFKSIDAGATWNAVGNIGNSLVNKILINPEDSSQMFATSANTGIYRSINAGANWQEVANDSEGYDIELKPGDPSTVFISGTHFYKSVDGGNSFTQISGFQNGAKMIGVSPDDPTIVYVLEANDGMFGGFYVSNNTGDSFTKLDHGNNNYFGYSITAQDDSGQAPRDMDIAVNPSNVNEVHIAGVLTWRSTNGGVSFNITSDWIPDSAQSENIGYCHADVDILEFIGNTLYVGTDGGIYKASDPQIVNSGYYTDLTSGIGIRQFYKLGISQTEDIVITGGSQDNGSSFYTEANDWKDWIGADGMEGFVDKGNNNLMFGTSQFGQLYRTSDGGNSLLQLIEPGPGQGNWVSPFEQDPATTGTIYVGYDKLYRSTNNGNSWTAVSQTFSTYLDHLKIAPSNNQVMYVARQFQIFKTLDGGTTSWQAITTPGGYVNSIAINPNDPNKIAVATTSSNRVYVSLDGGNTWTNYKKNLPNFSALALVWDDNGKNGLYLGMDYGIFYIDDTLIDWQPFSNNLPNVIINELEINNAQNKLYAASYGRGMWTSPLVEDVLGTSDFVNPDAVTIIPNPAKTQVSISFPHNTEGAISIYDLTGKLIYYKADVSFDTRYDLNVEQLQTGIYFLRINSTIGEITKKLIKE